MKTKTILFGLSLMSASAMANTYNAQLDVDYIDDDGFNVIALSGAYYFDAVKTAARPWAEAAFMGRNNNVSASYYDFDGDVTAVDLSAEFFGNSTNNLYGSIGITNVDTDFGGSESVIHGELGYFLAKNWLVSVETSDSDGSDPVYLKTKYIGELGNSQFFNVEARIDDEEHDLSVAGDYYWSAQSSVGLELSDAEGYDYGVRFQHFFTRNVAVRVNYVSAFNDDTIGVGLTARF